jgi:hypothetical protein
MHLLTRLHARGFAALKQVKPAQAVKDAEPLFSARATKDAHGLQQHVDGHVDFLLLRIGYRDLHPRRGQALLVLQDGAQFRRVVLDVLVQRNLDIELATLFVRDRDSDGVGHVRVARRREHFACAIDAVCAVGVDGRHAGEGAGATSLREAVEDERRCRDGVSGA